MELKIDFEKACDQVSQDLYPATLYDFEFPTYIVDLIIWGVNFASISILWNGSKISHSTPQWGSTRGSSLTLSLWALHGAACHSDLEVSRGGRLQPNSYY